MHTTDSERRLYHASIALVLAGIVFFFYGLVISVPELFEGVINIRASLLSSFLQDSALIFQHQTVPTVGLDPASARGAFLLAIFLVIFGATLDVWRRLHPLHRSKSVGPYDPMESHTSC